MPIYNASEREDCIAALHRVFAEENSMTSQQIVRRSNMGFLLKQGMGEFEGRMTMMALWQGFSSRLLCLVKRNVANDATLLPRQPLVSGAHDKRLRGSEQEEINWMDAILDERNQQVVVFQFCNTKRRLGQHPRERCQTLFFFSA